MKLVDSSIKRIPQGHRKIDILKHIEKVYMTLNHMDYTQTQNSHNHVMEQIVEQGDPSYLEHSILYLQIPEDEAFNDKLIVNLRMNRFSQRAWQDGVGFLTTNLRGLLESLDIRDWDSLNGALFNLQQKFLVSPSNLHKENITLSMQVSRGMACFLQNQREFRVNVEYDNSLIARWIYDNGITFVKPDWYIRQDICQEPKDLWVDAITKAEKDFGNLTKWGLSMKEARGILPSDYMVNVIMTGSRDQWEALCKGNILFNNELRRILGDIWAVIA